MLCLDFCYKHSKTTAITQDAGVSRMDGVLSVCLGAWSGEATSEDY